MNLAALSPAVREAAERFRWRFRSYRNSKSELPKRGAARYYVALRSTAPRFEECE
jgi:hypothetical protein